jgi:hypothetical protein
MTRLSLKDVTNSNNRKYGLNFIVAFNSGGKGLLAFAVDSL